MAKMWKKLKAIFETDVAFITASVVSGVCGAVELVLVWDQLAHREHAEIPFNWALGIGIIDMIALGGSTFWAVYRWRKFVLPVPGVSYNAATNEVTIQDPSPPYDEVTAQNRPEHSPETFPLLSLGNSPGRDVVDSLQDVQPYLEQRLKNFYFSSDDGDLPPNYETAEALAKQAKDDQFFTVQNAARKVSSSVGVDDPVKENEEPSSPRVNNRRQRTSSLSSSNGD